MTAPLQPGELTKPVRVWCTSTSIRIAWYQAEPISEQVTVFYKKSGSLFGTEIVLPTASLRGPDLSMRPPPVLQGKAEYYELDIRKLKPNTQYIVKVRAAGAAVASLANSSGGAVPPTDDPPSGPAAPPELTPFPSGPPIGPLPAAAPVSSVRSDRLSTLGVQEEIKRNLDMGNFVGSLIKLGEYDGTITAFEPATGLYEVRILQEEASSTPQLVRLASEYSDLGLPARTYTLSSIKFGRWGGEISSSQVVGEGEMRWIVGRAVQLTERSEAANTFALREETLHARNTQLSAQLDAQREAALASLALTRRTYKVVCSALLLLSTLLVAWAWMAALRSSGTAHKQVEAANQQMTGLKQQLRRLELYRAAMELDAGAWITKAASRGVNGYAGAGREDHMWAMPQHEPVGTDLMEGACTDGPDGERLCAADGLPRFMHSNSSDSDNISNIPTRGIEGGGHTPQQYVNSHTHHPLLDTNGPLLDALRRQPGSGSASKPGHTNPKYDGSADEGEDDGAGRLSDDKGPTEAGDGDAPWQQGSQWELSELDLGSDPPQPWLYVQHAATLYSLYVNEWVKQQMARSIRGHIKDLLAAQQAESGGLGSNGSVGDPSSTEQPAAGSDASDLEEGDGDQQAQGKPGKAKRGGWWALWPRISMPKWFSKEHRHQEDHIEAGEEWAAEAEGSRQAQQPARQLRRYRQRARVAPHGEEQESMQAVAPRRRREAQGSADDVRSMSQGKHEGRRQQARGGSGVKPVKEQGGRMTEHVPRTPQRRVPQREVVQQIEYDYGYDYYYSD